jgi:CrcB protein
MNLIAVFVGGLVGTALRLGLDALLPHPAAAFPWSTLIVNLLGSFALGVLVARVWPSAPEWLRFGLGTGLLGSFTTFSAVIASLFALTANDEVALAALYLGVSIAGGLLLAAIGLRWGSRAATEPTVDE